MSPLPRLLYLTSTSSHSPSLSPSPAALELFRRVVAQFVYSPGAQVLFGEFPDLMAALSKVVWCVCVCVCVCVCLCARERRGREREVMSTRRDKREWWSWDSSKEYSYSHSLFPFLSPLLTASRCHIRHLHRHTACDLRARFEGDLCLL